MKAKVIRITIIALVIVAASVTMVAVGEFFGLENVAAACNFGVDC